MDAIEALVRLDAAGWKSLPARPDLVEEGMGQLGRVLRRCSGLTAPDGRVFDFTPYGDVPKRLTGFSSVRALGHDVFLATHADRSWVVRLDGTGITVLAGGLGPWLGGLLSEPPIPESVEPDGEPPGWDLKGVGLPATLVGADAVDGHLGMDGWKIRVVHREPSKTEAVTSADDENLDDLFGAGSDRARPRRTRILLLVLVGVVVAVLGLACVTIPGGLMVLLGWMMVETDLEHLESGYFPESDRAEVLTTRNIVYACLVVIVVLFAIQAVLLCAGVYGWLLDVFVIPAWQVFVGGLLNPELG